MKKAIVALLGIALMLTLTISVVRLAQAAPPYWQCYEEVCGCYPIDWDCIKSCSQWQGDAYCECLCYWCTFCQGVPCATDCSVCGYIYRDPLCGPDWCYPEPYEPAGPGPTD